MLRQKGCLMLMRLSTDSLAGPAPADRPSVTALFAYDCGMDVVELGERVLLAWPEAEDEKEYLALLRASRRFLEPWEPLPPPGLRVDSPERFRRMSQLNATGEHCKLLVRRRDDNRVVGSMSLNNIVRGVFLNAHLGYWVGEEFARKGYMGEALRLALRHGFRTLGLHRLEANLMTHNDASRALVRGAGFRLEGVGVRFLRIAGEWRDHERWALLYDEWDGILK